MTGFRVKRRAAAFLLAYGLAFPARVHAEGLRVLLVRPNDAAPEVRVALFRVQGELVADGFEVVTSAAAPGDTSQSAMDKAESQSSTTVGLFLSPDGMNAELWVVDRVTKKTVVRHVATADAPQKLSPEVLALKAVELLRASLLELVVWRNPEAASTEMPAVTRRVSAWAARPIRERAAIWAVETGVAVIWSPAQVDPAFVSVGRGRCTVLDTLQLRASFVGLGTRAQISGTGGRASTSQWLGLVEGIFLPWPRALLKPELTLGGGVFHTSINGTASEPYQALNATDWAFVADAGTGLDIRFASRLAFAIEGHVLWTAPEPIARFVNEDGAHIGHPGVVGSLTLVGWL